MREVSEFKCPVCGREMIKRKGRFGEFLGCSGYSVKNRRWRARLHDDHQSRQGRQAAAAEDAADRDDDQVRERTAGTMILRDSKRGPLLGCCQLPQVPGDEDTSRSWKRARLKQVEALLPLLKEGADKLGAR